MAIKNAAECVLAVSDIAEALSNNDVKVIKDILPYLNDFNFSENKETMLIAKDIRVILYKTITYNEASKFLIDNINLKHIDDKTLVEDLTWAYQLRFLNYISLKSEQEIFIENLLNELVKNKKGSNLSKISELLSFSIVNNLSYSIIEKIRNVAKEYTNE